MTASEYRVVTLANEERANAGCGALRTASRLNEAARDHSADMATRNYFSHDTPEGRSFVDRLLAVGFPSPGGENIAMGQSSAQEVTTDWMNSPGHRRNILDCRFTRIGVGFDPRGNYWTEDFGY
jgi:uncharacterized protein YkwD